MNFTQRDVNGLSNRTYAHLHNELNSCKISDFRPFGLINSLYKMISKALVTRLEDLIEETISKAKGAFVVDRQISDVVLMANQVVEDCQWGGRSVWFKIYVEKTYMIMSNGICWIRY